MDSENEVLDSIGAASGEPQQDERVEYLENGIGPNFRVAIAPNGYIWFSVGVDLISTQGYCDSLVARAMARMLTNAAEELDRINNEIEAQKMLSKATNVIDLGTFRQRDEEQILSDEHEAAVVDAVTAEARNYN